MHAGDYIQFIATLRYFFFKYYSSISKIVHVIIDWSADIQLDLEPKPDYTSLPPPSREMAW